jgi:hypothetical protein
MAVEEGGKFTACGIYAAPLKYFHYVSEKIIPIHHRLRAQALANEETSSVISSPSTGARSVQHPSHAAHLIKLTYSKEAEKRLDC